MSPRQYLLMLSIFSIKYFSCTACVIARSGPITAGKVSYDDCLAKARVYSKGEKAYQLAGSFLEAEANHLRASLRDKDMLLQAKDSLLKEIEKSRNRLESELLSSLALGQAVLANRLALEGALRAYRMSLTLVLPKTLKTTSDQYNDFKDNFLLDASKNLHPDCVALLSDLSGYGIVAKLPDVKNEINDLFHTLSSPMHYSRKPLPNIPGIYIGGDQPMTAALAICMAMLQGQHHCDLELHVLDEFGKPKCRLVGGKVLTVNLSIRLIPTRLLALFLCPTTEQIPPRVSSCDCCLEEYTSRPAR